MNDSDMLIDIGQRCLALRTLSAARSIGRRYDAALRPTGLTITQFTLLVSVAGFRPQSITDLANNLSIERTALSRNLKLLEQEGLVTRTDEGAARKRSLKITKAGLEKLREAYPLWEETQKALEKTLGDQLAMTDAMLAELRGQDLNL